MGVGVAAATLPRHLASPHRAAPTRVPDVQPQRQEPAHHGDAGAGAHGHCAFLPRHPAAPQTSSPSPTRGTAPEEACRHTPTASPTETGEASGEESPAAGSEAWGGRISLTSSHMQVGGSSGGTASSPATGRAACREPRLDTGALGPGVVAGSHSGAAGGGGCRPGVGRPAWASTLRWDLPSSGATADFMGDPLWLALSTRLEPGGVSCRLMASLQLPDPLGWARTPALHPASHV